MSDSGAKIPVVPPTVLAPLARGLATALGAGLSPVAPGTLGSLVALVPLFFLPAAAWPWAPLAGAAVTTLACAVIARRLPAKCAGGDPRWFVLDEVAGMWLSALALQPPGPLHLGLAFVLFRLLDITKPPPLRRLEHVGRGFGIVLDDLGAGVYALALTSAAALVFPLN